MLKPATPRLSRAERKEVFRKIGEALTRMQDRDYYGHVNYFDPRPRVERDPALTVFRGQFGKHAPRMKVTQFERGVRRGK